jgi:hypothetical protein
MNGGAEGAQLAEFAPTVCIVFREVQRPLAAVEIELSGSFSPDYPREAGGGDEAFDSSAARTREEAHLPTVRFFIASSFDFNPLPVDCFCANDSGSAQEFDHRDRVFTRQPFRFGHWLPSVATT